MRKAGCSKACIAAFKHNCKTLLKNQHPYIRETSISPLTKVTSYDSLPPIENPALLKQAVVLKLNGGLGTSMGLDGPKSLLRVKGNLTFLDLIAKQVIFLRNRYNEPLRFLLMNSQSTSAETLEALKQHPKLGDPKQLEVMQSFVPKVDAETYGPVEHPADPDLEWCPPGHGDLYPSLYGKMLDSLLAEGRRYLFVSNSDNLGASLDLRLLTYFAKSRRPFLMEVCQRENADKKGGHLARRDTQLLLRESAQCHPDDQKAFQDINRHQFFNTNNLWINLESLSELLSAHHGFLPLPLISNHKTVDPKDPKSKRVIQLETAMGAAIELFPKAGAILVPRSRFSPVKTCNDLLGVRSDAYELTEDSRIVLHPDRNGKPPLIKLDDRYYKMLAGFEALTGGVAPSLRQCDKLEVTGPVQLNSAQVFRGSVNIVPGVRTLPPGDYQGSVIVV